MSVEKPVFIPVKGFHGLVETTDSLPAFWPEKSTGRFDRLKDRIGMNNRQAELKRRLIANQTARDRKVNLSLIKSLTVVGPDSLSRAALVDMFASIGIARWWILRQEIKEGRRGGYDVGLVLSDFLELLPPQLAAKILLASSDPDLSQDVIERNDGGLAGHDPQELSVESFVLLPTDIRLNIFREMVKQDPGEIGRASMMFRTIDENWGDLRSRTNGMALIAANLTGEARDAQISDVSGQLIQLGQISRGEAS